MQAIKNDTLLFGIAVIFKVSKITKLRLNKHGVSNIFVTLKSTFATTMLLFSTRGLNEVQTLTYSTQ